MLGPRFMTAARDSFVRFSEQTGCHLELMQGDMECLNVKQSHEAWCLDLDLQYFESCVTFLQQGVMYETCIRGFYWTTLAFASTFPPFPHSSEVVVHWSLYLWSIHHKLWCIEVSISGPLITSCGALNSLSLVHSSQVVVHWSLYLWSHSSEVVVHWILYLWSIHHKLWCIEFSISGPIHQKLWCIEFSISGPIHQKL